MTDKKQAKMVTWGFLIFLFLISAVSGLTKTKDYSETENRYLQKKPEFSLRSLADGTYGTDYEAYLSDQFPARNYWIRVKVMAEKARLKSDTNGVYFGKDGYLIGKFDSVDFAPEQLTKNIDRLASFGVSVRERLGEDHIRIMLVPSAAQILSDKLPFLAAPYDQNKVAERLKEQLRHQAGEGAAGMIVSVENALKERSGEEIYYRTDHHWTTLGAYYGYCAWTASVGFVPWQPDQFEIMTVSRDFSGTLQSKVNLRVQPDNIRLYMPKMEQKYQVYYDGGQEAYESMYYMDALKGKDQYRIFLDGNHGLTEIVNNSITEDRKEKTLLIIKDSFAHSFAPFAANHFEKVYMADLRLLNMSLDALVERTQATDVLVLYQIPGIPKDKSLSKLIPLQSQR